MAKRNPSGLTGPHKQAQRMGYLASAELPSRKALFARRQGFELRTRFVGSEEKMRAGFGRSGGLEVAQEIARLLSEGKSQDFGKMRDEVVKKLRGKKVTFYGETTKVTGGIVRAVHKRMVQLKLVRKVAVPIK